MPAPTAVPEARHPAPLGGQAIPGGVLMRGGSAWAVAVRAPDGGVAVRSFPLPAPAGSVPFVRGLAALAESFRLGSAGLRLSAALRKSPARWSRALAVAAVIAVALLFVAPALLAVPLRDRLPFWVAETAVRLAMVLAYALLLARLPGLLRYHGAEHKAVACHDAGLPLTVAGAARCSRLHPRCGTSFLLLLVVVAVPVFAPLTPPAWWLLAGSRLVGAPVVAALAFELFRRTAHKRAPTWARRLAWPGLQLQRLTTREPDAAELAVAIAALEAVLPAAAGGRAASGAPRIAA